ncbi:MAG: type II secretion system F family protein [Eubacterium sp.]|nr:type II secretion system F family protein [Eubacterium sp.]
MIIGILRILAIGLIPASLLLAIMSRKNFSKYKSVGIFGGIVLRVRRLLAGGNLYSETELDRVADEYAYKLFRTVGFTVGIVNILFLLLSWNLSQRQSDNVVQRPLSGDPPIEVDISTGDQGESNLLLEVYPREYTEDEFGALSDKAFEYARAAMQGENESLYKVTKDLTLITSDESGTLSLKWHSDRPDVIGSTGKIYGADEDVIMELTISDGVHERVEKIPVRTVSDTKDDSERLMALLKEYERQNRTGESVRIPEEMEGYKLRVSRESSVKKQIILYSVLAAMAGAYIYHKLNELKERKGKRQDTLRREFYSFTSRLSLLMGAGINVKEAMRLASEGSKELAGEVRFTVNRIDAGLSEEKAYLEMSGRIAIPEYTRLMTMISQNINHGNSKLLMLMDQEVKNAMNMKREHMRKKGETASEKLLIPTALLLVIVIGVIMIPALKTAM